MSDALERATEALQVGLDAPVYINLDGGKQFVVATLAAEHARTILAALRERERDGLDVRGMTDLRAALNLPPDMHGLDVSTIVCARLREREQAVAGLTRFLTAGSPPPTGYLAVNAQYIIEQAIAAEREACAKVAEGGRFLHDEAPAARFGKECAAAIRARGKEAGDAGGQ